MSASVSLRMAEAALWLTLGPSTARLDTSEAPGSFWADVTWSFQGQPRERFCYHLIEGADGYQIAVLAPMELAPAGSR